MVEVNKQVFRAKGSIWKRTHQIIHQQFKFLAPFSVRFPRRKFLLFSLLREKNNIGTKFCDSLINVSAATNIIIESEVVICKYCYLKCILNTLIKPGRIHTFNSIFAQRTNFEKGGFFVSLVNFCWIEVINISITGFSRTQTFRFRLNKSKPWFG